MSRMPAGRPNIVVLGGGTGSFTVLLALKKHNVDLTAIVNMADDGGSSGVLRDELGVLPAGDIRQCLVALSDSPKLRDLFTYRFDSGSLAGHSFGNLLLSALEKMSGDFSDAVDTAAEILQINGIVLPATVDNVRLKMSWPDASFELHGEYRIGTDHYKRDPREATLSLVPSAVANPRAIAAIKAADIVVVAPGNLYGSLAPLLVVEGIAEALQQTKAVKICVANLVSRYGQTDAFTVSDHAREVERFAGTSFIDYVLCNTEHPTTEVATRYAAEGAVVAEVDDTKGDHFQLVRAPLLGQQAKAQSNDDLHGSRSLIRHSDVVGDWIIRIYQEAIRQR